MKISRITTRSTVDGPGWRVVVHFQGCRIRCPECGNREMWDPLGGSYRDPYLLSQEIIHEYIEGTHDGITISGGEPFDQPKKEMLKLLRLLRSRIESIVIYSGYTIGHLSTQPWFRRLLKERLVDVLISGPYVYQLNNGTNVLAGSSNQQFHFYTDVHEATEFAGRKARVTILENGVVTIQGFPDLETQRVLWKSSTSSPAPTAESSQDGNLKEPVSSW